MQDHLDNLKSEQALALDLVRLVHAQPLVSFQLKVLAVEAAVVRSFIAWEKCLESVCIKLMCGAATIGGTLPTRYVMPTNAEHAQLIVLGTNRYVDWANIDFVDKLASNFFKLGEPISPSLKSAKGELQDFRTLRNAAAHSSANTQQTLSALAKRLGHGAMTEVTAYSVATLAPPNRMGSRAATMLEHYQQMTQAVAAVIAT